MSVLQGKGPAFPPRTAAGGVDAKKLWEHSRAGGTAAAADTATHPSRATSAPPRRATGAPEGASSRKRQRLEESVEEESDEEEDEV
jgi:hypothetical protein